MALSFTGLAFKNLLRRPMRSVLTVIGVALAVTVSVSLCGFIVGYRESLATSIERLGFQVMIMAKGCPYEAATMMMKGGTGLLYLPSSIYDRVKSDPDVAVITPIFVGVAEKEGSGIRENSAKSFTVINGVDGATFRTMKPWLVFRAGTGYAGGRWFAPDAQNEIVMGYEAATYEQRKVGDRFYLTITPNGAVEPVTKEYTVVGVLDRTGSQDDGTVFLPFGTAQQLFNRPNSLTIVGVKLKEFSRRSIEDFTQRWITLPEVQVVGLEQVKSTLVSLIGTAQTMVAAVAVVAVVVAIIGVVNTILMSVYERTGEIGIMKAVGAYRGDIFRLIWIETVAVCVSGGILGCALAMIGSSMVAAAITSLINLGVTGTLVHITPTVIGMALIGAIVVGFFAGLYPAWRAASMRPIDAIREGIG